MPRKIQRYGWIPDLPDHRDFLYAAPIPTLRALPTSVDLRPQCPPVYDQGQLGSCTGNAIAGAIHFDRLKQKLDPNFAPSRLFIYYNERDMEGTVDTDSGAQIRDGMKSVSQQGACSEEVWPYDISKFAIKPSQNGYDTALQHKAKVYSRLSHDLAQMKGCLASGFPFVFGFAVYESFESSEVAQTGHAPMPGPADALIGGHAVVAVGYDDSVQVFFVRNSWGDGWGMKGYFTLPYAYLTQRNLSSDFWTIRTVE